MWKILSMASSKHPLMRRTIILTTLVLNFLLLVQDVFIKPIRLNVFDYLAFNFFLCFFLLIVGSLFLMAGSFKQNDPALQLQLRLGRFKLGVFAGLFAALSMVTLMQGALKFEISGKTDVSAIPLAEFSSAPSLLLVFFVFFVYGLFSYYLIVVFFGFLFRRTFRGMRR